MRRLSRPLFAVVSLGVTDDCDEDAKATRRFFTGASLFLGVVSPIWGAMYIIYGELGPGLIPSIYSAITLVSFVVLWRVGGWQWFRVSQIILIFVLPIALMLSLGGYVLGSNVIIWALLAPLGSAWGGRSREATFWVVAFLLGAILSGVVDPYLRDSNDLPETVRTVLFVMNLIAVIGILFLLLDSFVRQKDTLIGVMRRNRELESAFMDQELTLRQSDKLATLGKLSAGLAHELNNPTAAAQQATQQLKSLLFDAGQLEAETTSLGLLDDEQKALSAYVVRAGNRIHQPEFLDPLDRSDREDEIQGYLEGAGVDDPWEVAPSLVAFGLELSDIEALAAKLRSDRFGAAVTLLATLYKRQSLLGSLDESTARIVEMVKALKSYTYLDQAPRQLIDVHEGLDSTLVMLQSRLRTGVEVTRSYANDVPLIDGYGGELNQVWTNILDNAVDAMDGQGAVRISTSHSGAYVVVEVTDNGPGVSADIAERIFDPFVTTKAPGEGTGLGLNISHNIVQKHSGDISLASQPGATTFTVRLPIAGVSQNSQDGQRTERASIGQGSNKERHGQTNHFHT